MKKCPFCAEEIQDEAIKCRWCNEFLDGSKRNNEETKKEKAPWYCRTSTIIVGFCLVGPLVLPLVWINPKFSPKNKALISVAIVVVTLVLAKLMARSIQSLNQYYNVLEGF